MLKFLLKKVLPERTIESLHVRFPNERAKNVGKYYAEEIDKIDIEAAGVDERGYAFIKIKDGLTFYSFAVTEGSELITYKFLSNRVKKILPKECVRCAKDIVGRYWYPHMVPNSKPDYPREIRKYFHPQHYDTIDDFNCSEERKAEIKKIFEFKEGDIVVDAGCHTGIGAMAVAEKIGDSGKVIALEADPDCYELLDHALGKNGFKNIQHLHKPVWKEKKEMVFSKRTYEQNSFVKDILHNERNSVKLQADSIDNIVKDLGLSKVDYISLTINGVEPEGLVGAKETIANSEHIRLCIPGWYSLEGVKIWKILEPTIKEFGLDYEVGPTGKVLAWK